MSTGQDRDDILDPYLEGDSALSRAYRDAATQEPPAHIDRLILEGARRGVPDSPPAHSPFARSWAVPASLAAVVVLSVSVVLLSSFPEAPGPLENGQSPGQAMPRDAGRADDAQRTVSPPPPTAPAKAESRETQPKTAEPTAGEPSAERESAPTLRRKSAATPSKAQARPAPPGAAEDRAPAELKRSAPRAPAGTEGAASSFAPPPGILERKPGALRSQDGDGAAAAGAVDPQAWLEAIEALLAQGDSEAARAELAAFLAAFPDYPLGERLQAFREANPGLERSDKAQ